MRGSVVAGLALIVLACGQKSPDEKLLDATEAAGSWIATAQFAAECWAGNRVPSAFLRNTIDAADKALQDAMKTADESKARPSLREAVRRPLQEARVTADDVRAAVQRGDRKAIDRARAQFAAAHLALDRLREQR